MGSSLASIAALAALAASALGPTTARGAMEGEPVFLELVATRTTYFVHEPIELLLRFGCEEEFLGARMIQPFRQQLDVPVQIEADWLVALAGTRRLDRLDPRSEQGSTVAIGDDIARVQRAADRIDAGRRYAVFELAHRLSPEQSGELVVPGATLRYAHASEFRESVLAERRPVDRTDDEVRCPALRLEILPLPEEGRPLDFAGAVGQFTLRAECDRRSVTIGESFEVRVHIEGPGHTPAGGGLWIRDIPGFHVRGTLEERSADAVRIALDIAALDLAAVTIPPLTLSFFDPSPPGGYRTVETAPLPIEVRTEPAPPADPGDPAGGEVGDETPGGRARAVAFVVPVLLAAALLVWLLRSRRTGPKRLRP